MSLLSLKTWFHIYSKWKYVPSPSYGLPPCFIPLPSHSTQRPMPPTNRELLEKTIKRIDEINANDPSKVSPAVGGGGGGRDGGGRRGGEQAE